MEECEALCTRLVIMVNGKFKCLGSPQHLKSKFGTGYKISLRLKYKSDPDKLFEFMKTYFPSQTTLDIHKRLFEFTVPLKDTKLSRLFKLIEKNRSNVGINDYSISQTTLDQIFVDFANQQDDQPVVFEPKYTKKDSVFSISTLNDKNGEISLSNKGSCENMSSNFETSVPINYSDLNDDDEIISDKEISESKRLSNLSIEPSSLEESEKKNCENNFGIHEIEQGKLIDASEFVIIKTNLFYYRFSSR
jgi:hypothetical protein